MRSSNDINKNVTRVFTLLCLAGTVLAGCAGVRQFTYPNNFVYLNQTGVSNLMHSLSRSMLALDHILEQGDAGPNKTSAILAELETIESIASRFTAKYTEEDSGDLAHLRTNHLLIDDHIDEFLANVSMAKLQVQAQPPNYYILGQLTGGCNSCHRRR